MMNNAKRYPEAHRLPSPVRNALISQVDRALDVNPVAVEKAISVLFYRQTQEERRREDTIVNNALGVRANHGKRIAYYGKWLASGKHLSGRHLDFARKIAKTYARTQLFELAAVKAGLVAA